MKIYTNTLFETLNEKFEFTVELAKGQPGFIATNVDYRILRFNSYERELFIKIKNEEIMLEYKRQLKASNENLL